MKNERKDNLALLFHFLLIVSYKALSFASSKDNTQLTSTVIKTNQGLIGGSVTLSNDNAVGTEITATLSEDALIREGSWTWERSKSLSSKNWEQITGKTSIDANSLKSTYIPETTDAGYYIRATFHVSPNQSFTGSASETTSTVIRKEMLSVKIQKNKVDITNNDMVVGTLLSAVLDPTEFETEITYYWYHDDDPNTIIGTGKQYLLNGKDVDKQVYVKAVAKNDGSAIGEVKSNAFGPVQKAVNPKPTSKIEIVNDKTTDISITVKLPDSVNSGLYQFAYLKDGESIDKRVEYEAYTRGHNPIEIRGLKSNTQYYFYVRQIGENGYADSEWCDEIYSVVGKTDLPHLVGTIKIEGDPIYDVVLNSTLENGVGGQTYQKLWYRIDADGNRLTTNAIGTNYNYTPKQADIGYRLEVEYKGYGDYAGTITAQTEEIRKAEVHAPYNGMDESKCSPIDDTTIRLVLPESDDAINGLTANEKFIIGYSTTSGGVPIEYREGPNNEVKIFEPSTTSTTQTVDLTGFQRNTTYYFFLRYAEQSTHFKSDWSAVDNCIQITTKQTPLGGNISFAYQTNDYPVQKDKLTAFISDAKTTLGTWKWTEISPDKQTQTNMNNFFPDGPDKTYIMIPEDKPAGTTYKVEFIPESGYSGSLSLTSKGVVEFKTEPYPVPAAVPVESSKTDTTLTFKMSGINLVEGAVYEFRYGTSSNVNDAGNLTSPLKAYKDTDVTITGLNRNTLYHIWVRRAGDDVRSESEWTSATLDMTTELTDLHGYVTIDETPVAGVPLSATYTSASYIPIGIDTDGGTWQWYRTSGNDWTEINGATSDKYTPTSDDINKQLKARFTGGGNFKNYKEAVSDLTRKELVAADPQITSLNQIADSKEGYLTIEAKLNATSNIWYQLRKTGEDPAALPTDGYTSEKMTANHWTKATSTTVSITTDWNKQLLTPDTNYILYVVQAETDTKQPSNIVNSSVSVGQLTQRGNITYSGNTVVTQKIKATLNESNNADNSGTWKWYISKQSYLDGQTTAPSITDTTAWDQIPGGYTPSVNDSYSELTLTENMFAHYVRAEFVANENLSYKGTISGASTSYVKKIYKESLTLTSSTKDGNNKPKVYSGTVITGTIDNYIGSQALDKERTTVQFQVDTSAITTIKPTNFTVDTANNKATFTYTMPLNDAYDGKTISAVVSKPKDYMLYVDSSLKPITIENLDSIKTGSNIGYQSGIAISTKENLRDFLTAAAGSAFTSRTAKYVLTSNIDMSSITIDPSYLGNTAACQKFYGTFDGDYHTVTGMKTLFFSELADAAVVKNLIINKSNATVVATSGYYRGGTALAAYATGNATIERVFLSQSILRGAQDAGGLVAKYENKEGKTITFNECIVSGTDLYNTDTNKHLIGGITGAVTGNVTINNTFTIKSSLNDPNNTNSCLGALVGGTYSSNTAHTYTITNSYASSQVPTSVNAGGIMGRDYNASQITTRKLTNAFYDVNIATGNYSTATPAYNGTPLQTQAMVYNKLSLGDKWTYSPGYYPRLKWVENHPITLLYTATRGAFTSLDSKTSSDQMFSGTINGPIKVPLELQKSTYTYESSDPNVLKVTSGGTIIPVGNQGTGADIKITYTEPDQSIGGGASNTFHFTVGTKATALSNVTIQTNMTNPGQTLSVPAVSGATYKWYRRPAGSADRVEITGQTANTYMIQPADIGNEINVDVIANGYPTSSNYTPVITSVAPVGIDKSNLTDNSVDVKAQGIEGANYEYAYATSLDGKKTIVGQSTTTFTISGLSRNSDYWLFARVAGAANGSYEPSAWSNVETKIHTAQTDVIGPVILSSNVNADMLLTARISDTNLQKGDWKLERVNLQDNSTTTLTPASTDDYNLTYNLTLDDAGSKIRVSYVGKGEFKGEVFEETEIIKKKIQSSVNTLPQAHSEQHTDKSLTVSEPASETDTKYQFGISTVLNLDIKEVEGTFNTDEQATITGLERNTVYYVYARKAGKTEYEPSAWSGGMQMTTKKTDISSSMITEEGTPQVDKELKFTLNSTSEDTKAQTGLWKLERVKGNETNTLTPEVDGYTITYQVAPEDSGSEIKATYIGTGSYTGEPTVTTTTVVNASQSIGSIIPSVYSSNLWKEYSIDAYVPISLGEASDIYEFGYRKKGSTDPIKPYPVTVTRGNVINVNPVDDPLTRDTAYEIYVRKAEKIGYNASDWSNPAVDSGTSKTMLTGNITFTGDVAVNETITVNYEPGSYPNPGDDTGGTWKWYLGDDPDPVSTTTSYTIPPTEGNPDLRVEYIPAENSGFTQNVTRMLGTVKKAPYEVPAAAEVTAMDPDNANEGSVLHLINKDVDSTKNDIYIYLKEATDDILPTLQTVSEVTDPVLSDTGSENIDRWILAESTMDVRVPANRSYVVYSARLESKTNKASEISSARGTLSKKEPLKRAEGSADGFIRESDETVVWKALQEKTLEYSLYSKAPTAIWKYYVAKKPDDPNLQFDPLTAIWQNIDAELKDNGRQDVRDEQNGVYTSTISVPMKYTDYYIKAVLKGTDDYEGEVEYISKAPLEGTMIDQKGAVLIKGDTTKLLDILVAKYTATDDETGTFTWYRETAIGSNQYETIGKPTNGTESSYQTVREDYNKHIYAVYTASPKSTYSGSSQTNAVLVSEKAEQETPSMVEKVQVNGNSVQVTIPENYKKENMDKIPRVIIGYQKTDESGNPLNDSQIVWQINDKIGNNWIRNLDRYSYYVFYAKFEGTELYADSAISAKTNPPVKTENDLFDEGNLSITSKLNDSARNASNASDIGNGIHVTYTGDGYDEGYFSLKRSNGEVIDDQVAANVDSTTKTISFDYTYSYEDIGNNIIVEYTATDAAKHYDGMISKSNGVIVTKPESKETAEIPTMKRGLDTDLLVEIKAGYEYCLDTSMTAPAADSGDWNILEENKADEKGYHDFLGLERTTTYYLHARIAETKETQASEAVTSEGMTPEPYIDMGAGHTENQVGNIEIDKTKTTAPALGSGDKITFPYTLTPGKVTLSDMKLTRQSDGTVVKLEGIDTFVNADDTASDAVYEWGSTNANKRFAADLQMYDAGGNPIDSSRGTKNELTSEKDGSMQLTIYRANGVDKGGTYIWEAMLKDSEGKTALLRSEVTFITNIDMVVPIRIDMYLEGGKYIKQNTNIASLHNQIYLPAVIGVDKQARAATTGVPALKGLWTDGTVPKNGEAYLKISNDGTNYTAPWNSVWLNTERTDSKIVDLLALGHNARGGYYVSGIASETQNWPWENSTSGVNEIPQAYGIKFVTKISPDDIRIETRKQLDFKDLEE